MSQSKGAPTRKFGFIFATFLLIVAVSPVVLHHGSVRVWAVVLATIFALLAIVAPKTLTPLEAAWQKLGLLLHHVTNPIFMALIFWVAFVPTALLLRLMGKELLPMKRDAAAPSYWITRDKPGISAASMSRQF
ncbi:MAG TPA: SxtJ family membrane protein [Caulobacteraceae bacterium]|jgi:hypothetical protein